MIIVGQLAHIIWFLLATDDNDMVYISNPNGEKMIVKVQVGTSSKR